MRVPVERFDARPLQLVRRVANDSYRDPALTLKFDQDRLEKPQVLDGRRAAAPTDAQGTGVTLQTRLVEVRIDSRRDHFDAGRVRASPLC